MLYTNTKIIQHKKNIFKNTFGETFTFFAQDVHFRVLIIPSREVGLHHNY